MLARHLSNPIGWNQLENLDLIQRFASTENKKRKFPISKETFIDYQRGFWPIFSDKTSDSLDDPNTAVFAPNHKLGSLSKKFWKGTNGEDLEMELKVKSVKGDGKSVLDNCHVWHLIERVGSCFKAL